MKMKPTKPNLFNQFPRKQLERVRLREIHEGDCGHHAGSKSLVAKAFRHGFYWLIAHADAEDLVK